MKIYKHKTKKSYIFINDASEYLETFKIDKFKRKLKTEYFDSEDASDKKEYKKYQDNLLTKGFELFEVTADIQEKTDQLLNDFELNKDHYFIEKNEKSILNSSLIKLHLTNNNSEFQLHRISSELEDDNDNTTLPTLESYMLGYVATERDKLSLQNITGELRFYFNLLFTLGFEPQTEEQLTSLCLAKPITKDTVFDGSLFRHENGYIHVATNYDLKCVKFIIYKITGDTITNAKVSYSILETAEIDDLLKSYKEDEKFEPINEDDFHSQFKAEVKEPVFFYKPEKEEASFPKFPFEVPEEVIEIDAFFNTIIEENKYYFFADTTSENPEEWLVAFMCCTDKKEGWYVYAKPFLLKDLNKKLQKPKEIELKYSSDKKDFGNKQVKAFNKNNLKAIKTATIIEQFSGKTIAELATQKQIETFVDNDYYNAYVFEAFENYACIRGNTINHLYWQFFKDVTERQLWLKENETKNTTLYKDEINFILKHTNHYLEGNNSDIKNLKKKYINDPLLKDRLSKSYDIDKFIESELSYQEGKHVKSDYIFSSKNENYSDKKIIVVKGDLIVDGTLFFKDNSDNYIIIKGDLKAKNLIVNWNCGFIYIEGNIAVENITKSHYKLIGENAKTGILLHQQKDAPDIKSNFKYEYDVSFYSTAITNKAIIKKGSYNSLEWDEEEIYKLLSTNAPFLKDKIENTKTDLDEYYKHKFENRMQDWGYFYPEYAGCEMLSISEDNEIKGNDIYPGGGDWVVNDLRGKSGTYGVSHEDYSIYKLKVKNPTEFKIDYKQKPLKLLVTAEELMNRYIRISMLYMNWAHRKTVSFEIENTDATYQKEKAVFNEDPHLALYWLNHFGATLDARYHEVVQLIEENNLVEKLEILKEPLAFFKKTDAFYNLEISNSSSGNKDEFKDLFLKRRSFLIYREQVYKNYDPKNLELWWKSITIYPKVEENLVVRMRWLKNNLNKCGNWDAFDKLIKEEDKDIPLLSYIFAFNPNTSNKDKTKYADILISELYEHRNHFKTPHKKQFGEILLWDVRDFVSDKAKLKEVAKFYFQGNETCKEYQDIQAVLGEKNENIEEVRTVLESLNTAFEGYDRFNTPTDEKPKYHKNIVAILDTLTPETLVETALNIQNTELAKRYFVYLWNSQITNKKEALLRLFIYIEMSGHDIGKEIFGADFARLVKGDDDPNMEIAQALLTIPEADFRNDSMWQNSKQAAAKFFLTAAHEPKIFSYLIETIKQAPTKENQHILDAVYTTLFSEEYDSKINPVLKFSKEQVETMLETICEWFLKYGYHAEGCRSIYGCSNPLAEEWLKIHLNDKKWMKQFAHISTFYDPLDQELQDAFKSALEYIEQGKHDTYLEFKDEKSHKFWEISFFRDTFNVTYGKVGTKGRESEKSFETEQECYKAGDKLVAQKLKKGYKKTDNI
ncbi:WGR domain-containing protein [Maribacter sp. BPC-D8]|uniref:WGR domain-containing protein n=1 Tax=Maribacter sp. BPC-D8 TaxID=3053613 RepID=UPI002B48183C|nr:WGR domain-containing protein [Maribacter sp. BPC-D8]WRI31541.1 WGR domain-containing protein [Maribacter sp. BPC-D8]